MFADRLKCGRKILPFAGIFVAVALPVVAWGQAQVQLIHPKDGMRHAFDVATIKPSADTASGLRFQLSPSHFSATHASVYDLIKFAYGIKSEDQLVGASGWMKSEYFDIQAKASDADIAVWDKLDLRERMIVARLPVQSLLEDRFQLKAKVETRNLPVYALVVAKGGPKMKEVELSPPGAHRPHIGPSGPNQYTAGAWPMSQMADWLGFFDEAGNRAVVDETGLKGYYDFVLNGVSQRFPGPANFNGVEAPDPPVSIFSALPDQLGLKLVPEKAPTEVLVIESIEQPSAN